MKMIKQEVVKAITTTRCLKKAEPIIEKYSKLGYKLIDTEFSRSPMWILYILTFDEKD